MSQFKQPRLSSHARATSGPFEGNVWPLAAPPGANAVIVAQTSAGRHRRRPSSSPISTARTSRSRQEAPRLSTAAERRRIVGGVLGGDGIGDGDVATAWAAMAPWRRRGRRWRHGNGVGGNGMGAAMAPGPWRRASMARAGAGRGHGRGDGVVAGRGNGVGVGAMRRPAPWYGLGTAGCSIRGTSPGSNFEPARVISGYFPEICVVNYGIDHYYS